MNKSMQQFCIRERANIGVELKLYTTDGDATPWALRIRGTDSDAFRLAEAASRRRAFEVASNGDMAPGDFKRKLHEVELEERAKLVASLVISWNFTEEDGSPTPFTEDAVIKFITEAPQIADQIDRIASRRKLFFAESLKPSTPSPVLTSSSPSAPPEATSPSVNT